MTIVEVIKDIEGTEAGAFAALILAMLSAMAHATFGAINKAGDPILTRGMINLIYGTAAAPFALYFTPWPTTELWPYLGAMFCAHIFYEWFQSKSFETGAFVLVYPIGRGSGPLLTALFASYFFAEQLSGQQWMGIFLISSGILGLAAVNLLNAYQNDIDLKGLRTAIIFALLTGLFISIYTMIDAKGIRIADNPFTFLAWFFFTGLFGSPIIALVKIKRTNPTIDYYHLFVKGFFGAIVAVISFGCVMLATRLGSVATIAAIRETSIIFGTAIGVLIFKEKITPMRLSLILLIVVGAIVIEI